MSLVDPTPVIGRGGGAHRGVPAQQGKDQMQVVTLQQIARLGTTAVERPAGDGGAWPRLGCRRGLIAEGQNTELGPCMPDGFA